MNIVYKIADWYSHKKHLAQLRYRNIKFYVKAYIEKLAINTIVKLNKDSNYIKHFLKEYEFRGKCEGMDRLMRDQVVELLAVLATQGDSGFSIGFKRRLFDRAASFKILSPLTFSDEEFNIETDLDRDSCQNSRLSSVFKYDDGTYQDIDAMNHITYNYRYDIAVDKLVEYNYGGYSWSGNVILYNRDDKSYHYYKSIISNFDNYMGENHCTIKSIEVYDSSDTRNDYYCNVGCVQDIPENFYKDYKLVINEKLNEKRKDELEFCRKVDMYSFYEKAKELQKSYVRKED